MWASEELVTKRSPPLLDTEVLQNFWSASVFFLVALNVLALSLFVLNLAFPHWQESIRQWKSKRRQQQEKASSELQQEAVPAPPTAETKPEMEPENEVLPPPPPLDAPQEEEVSLSEPTESLSEASDPAPTISEPHQDELPSEPPVEAPAEAPDASALEAEEAETENPEPAIEEEFVAPPPQPEIEEEYIPPPPPPPLESSPLDEVFEEKTEVYSPEEAPSSPPLPPETESGETMAKPMEAQSKILLDDKLEDVFETPVDETEEIPIFDTSLLDEQIESRNQDAKSKGDRE